MENEDTQITLRDSIENAIEEHAPEIDVQTDNEVTARPRDEAGKFVQKQAEPEVTPEITPEVVQTKPRPTSWKKDYDEHWTKLDPTLQDYIG